MPSIITIQVDPYGTKAGGSAIVRKIHRPEISFNSGSVVGIPYSTGSRGYANDEDWQNTGNVKVDDDTFSSLNIQNLVNPPYARAIHCTFAVNIPTDSKVAGYECTIERKADAPNYVYDYRIFLRNTFDESPAKTAGVWPTSNVKQIYGGPNDTWGRNWSPPFIYGIALEVTPERSGSGYGQCYVDFMQLKVYYAYSIPSVGGVSSTSIVRNPPVTGGSKAGGSASVYVRRIERGSGGAKAGVTALMYGRIYNEPTPHNILAKTPGYNGSVAPDVRGVYEQNGTYLSAPYYKRITANPPNWYIWRGVNAWWISSIVGSYDTFLWSGGNYFDLSGFGFYTPSNLGQSVGNLWLAPGQTGVVLGGSATITTRINGYPAGGVKASGNATRYYNQEASGGVIAGYAYPWIIGNRPVYPDTDLSGGDYLAVFGPFLAPVDGILLTVSVFTMSFTPRMTLGVYGGTDSLPGTLLGVTQPINAAIVNDWTTLPLQEPIQIRAGSYYWLACAYDDAIVFRWTGSGEGYGRVSGVFTEHVPGTLPVTPEWQAPTIGVDYSIQARYLPGTIMVGGTKANGSASVNLRSARAFTGGLGASGSATVNTSVPGRGGASIGGAASHNFYDHETMSGGLGVGGSASVFAGVVNETGTGGATCAGTAIVSIMGVHLIKVGPGKDVPSLTGTWIYPGNYAIGFATRDLTKSYKVRISDLNGNFSATNFPVVNIKSGGVTQCVAKVIENGGTWLRFALTSIPVRAPQTGDLIEATTISANATIDYIHHDREVQLIECYAFEDSGRVVNTQEWTTSAECYIKIYTPPDQRHNGTFGSGYHLTLTSPSSGYLAHFFVSAAYTWIDGLAVTFVNPNTNWGFELRTGNVKVSNCLVRGTGMSFVLTGASTNYLWNNVVFCQNGSWQNYTFYSYTYAQPTFYIYNCTAYGGKFGYVGYDYTTVHCKNCLSAGASSTGFSGIDTLSYCSTTDASLPATNGNLNNRVFTFQDPSQSDFHILTTDTGAYRRGTNLRYDASLAFNTDVAGSTRPSVWSIGAFEAGVEIIVPQGGTKVGGSSTSRTRATLIGDGGSRVGGQAYVSKQTYFTADGGVLVNGDMDETSHVAMNGGVAINGLSEHRWCGTPSSSGGTLSSGDSQIVVVQATQSIADFATSGVAFIQSFYPGIGGLAWAGESPVELLYPSFESDGGTKLGGSAVVTSYEVRLIGGGIRLSGDAIRTTVVTTSGGVKIGGTQINEGYVPNPGFGARTSRVLGLTELNWLDQRIFVGEVLEKTDSRGLMWGSTRSLVQFEATDLPFDYNLTQTQFGIVLDIRKNGKFFGTVSSENEPFVKQLFDQVVMIAKDDRRLKQTFRTLWSLP